MESGIDEKGVGGRSRKRDPSARRRRSGGRGDALSLAIAGIILGAAFAFGAVHAWASAFVEMAIWVTVLVSGALVGLRSVPRSLRIVTAVFLAYLAVQLLPMPRAIVAWASPGAEEIFSKTLDPLPGWIRDAVPGVAVPEPQAASSWLPADWRPIALHPFAARTELLRYLSYLGILLLAAFCRRPAFCLRALVGAAAAVAFFALFQSVSWNGRLLWIFAPYDTGVVPTHPRITGPFVNADMLATLLQMVVAPGIALLIRQRQMSAGEERERDLGTVLFLLFAVILVIAALLATASRGGISGTALSLLVLWAWRPVATAERERDDEGNGARKEKEIPWWRRLVPLIAGLAILVMSLEYAGPKTLDTLDERVGRDDWASDLELRLTMWKETLEVIRDFPAFGVGAGGWRDAVPRYLRYPDVGYEDNHAHNDWIEWVSEVGAVGSVLSALVGVGLLLWASSNRDMSRGVRSGIAGSALGLAWHEVFNFGLRAPANACMLAALVGIACNRNWKRRAESSARAEESGAVGKWATAAVIAALVAASAAQLREGLFWIRLRGGEIDRGVTPADPESWRFLAVNLQRDAPKDPAPVLAALRGALERRPALALALRELAIVAVDPRVKREIMEAALFLSPTRAPWRASYAALFDSQGDRQRALAEIETATYLDPVFARHVYLTPSAGLAPALIEAAERGFNRALEEHPNDPWLLFSVGSFYATFDMWEQAAKLHERAAAADGNWTRFGSLAGRYRARAGQFAEAETDLRSAVAASPDSAPSYQHLAVEVLKPQGRLDEATEVLETGIRRAQPRIVLQMALYDVQWARGDRKAALVALAQAADLAPRNADLRFRLGQAYLEYGDSRRAAAAFDRAIHLDDKRAYFHAFHAAALERENELPAARMALRRALSLEPGNPAYAQRLQSLERKLIGP